MRIIAMSENKNARTTKTATVDKTSMIKRVAKNDVGRIENRRDNADVSGITGREKIEEV